MGRLAIQAILQRDYPVLMALNLMVALMVIFGSLLADLLYSVADPRIRYSS
jgi:peptide/nickel transport system permease protein